MSFADKIKEQEEQAQKEGIASNNNNNWYKFLEGDNAFRVLSEPVMFFEKYKVGICYTDCGYQGSAKFMAYVLDKKDNLIKIAKLPYLIGTTIAGYENDEDYGFTGFPMPYDIKVNAKNAGTKEVVYTVTPRPSRDPVASEIKETLMKKKSIEDVLQAMKDKKKEEHMQDGTFQKNQELKKQEQEQVKKDFDEARNRPEPKNEVAPGVEYPTDEINPEDIPF